MFPTKYSGYTQWDVTGPRARFPIWEIRLKVFREFGLDAWIQTGISWPQPKNVHTTSRIINETDDCYETETVIETAKGYLVRRESHPLHEGSWVTRYPGSNPHADQDRIECLLEYDPEDGYDVSGYHSVVKAVGDDGLVFCTGTAGPAINWWLTMCGSQTGIIDVAERGDELRPLFDRYNELLLKKTEIACREGVKYLECGGSQTSLSLLSPNWYREFVLPVISAQAEICHRYGTCIINQLNGRGNGALDMLKEADMDCTFPLERPPLGDIDMTDAKQRIGDRVCLMGNVDPVHTLLQGTPDDVEREVREIVRVAGPTGLIVSTSDQTARDTPPANIEAFRRGVEA
jgi:uroporphyrinogen decarboxylase